VVCVVVWAEPAPDVPDAPLPCVAERCRPEPELPVGLPDPAERPLPDCLDWEEREPADLEAAADDLSPEDPAVCVAPELALAVPLPVAPELDADDGEPSGAPEAGRATGERPDSRSAVLAPPPPGILAAMGDGPARPELL